MKRRQVVIRVFKEIFKDTMRIKPSSAEIENSVLSKSLCVKCRWGMVIRGVRGEEIAYCKEIDKKINVCVDTCSSFDDKTVPSRHEYEELAWVLNTNEKKVVGFRPPKKREDRFD